MDELVCVDTYFTFYLDPAAVQRNICSSVCFTMPELWRTAVGGGCREGGSANGGWISGCCGCCSGGGWWTMTSWPVNNTFVSATITRVDEP